MKIIHSTFSSRGGAGVVATRLNDVMLRLGQNSILQIQTNSDLRDQPLASPAITLAAAADQYIVSKSKNPVLFSSFRNRLGVFDGQPVKQKSIYNLHWINGLYTRKGLKRLVEESNFPVYWTIHDMSPFTGGCHHNLGCNSFKADCSGCPQVRPVFQNQVQNSMSKMRDQIQVYEQIKYIAPSNWIKKTASESLLLRNAEIEIIPNPVSTEIAMFSETLKPGSDEVFHSDLHLAIVANNLSDPNKQVDQTLRALLGLQNCKVKLIGNNGNHFVEKYSQFVTCTGPLQAREISQTLSKADALIVMSIAENAPLVIAEAGMLGLPTIVLKGNGADEMITDQVNGFIVRDFEDLHLLSNQLVSNRGKLNEMKVEVKKSANSMYSPKVVAEKYLRFYSVL